MIRAAVRGLEASCKDDCYWVSDVPYGGTGDLKSVDYPTAVAIRAILAASSIGDPAYQTHVMSHRLEMTQRRARTRGLVSATLLAALIGTALTPVDESVVNWLGSDVERTLSAIGSVLSSSLAVTALIVAVMPESTRIVMSKLRRRLRF